MKELSTSAGEYGRPLAQSDQTDATHPHTPTTITPTEKSDARDAPMKAVSAGSAMRSALFAFAVIGLFAAPAMATENTVIGIDLGTTVRACQAIFARMASVAR